MGKEKNKHEILPLIKSAPEIFQEEFGSIIRMTGLPEVFEKLIIPECANPNLGYHFMMRHFLSKDEKYCATAGSEGYVVLWDLEKTEPYRIFKGHTGHVTSVCITPDNSTVISAGKDKTVRIWDIVTGNCRIVDSTMDSVYCLAINNDGSLFASSGKDSAVRLWQTGTGRLVRTYKKHRYSVLCLCFSPDGNNLLSAGGDGNLIEWNLYSDGCRTIYGGSHIIDALAVSADYRYILVGSREKSLKLIKRKNGNLLKEILTNGINIFDISFSCDGKYAAVCGRPRNIMIYSIPSGKCIKKISLHNEHIHKIDFLKDRKSLISSSGDTTIRVWDLRNDMVKTIIKGDSHVIRCIDIKSEKSCLSSDKGLLSTNARLLAADKWLLAADKWLLAAGTGDGLVKVWDVTTCRLMAILHGHEGLVRAVHFNPLMPYLYTGSWDGNVRSWNTDKWECVNINKDLEERIYSLSLPGYNNWIYAADHTGVIKALDIDLSGYFKEYRTNGYCYAVSSNKCFLAAGSGPRIVVWNLLSGKRIELNGHTDDIYSLVMDAQRPLLLSAAMDGALRLWNLETGKSLREYKGHNGRVTNVVADKTFTKAFSVSTDGTLRQWNISTGECENILYGHNSPVHGLLLVENKNLVITGSDDGTICFWDIANVITREKRPAGMIRNNDIILLATLSVYTDYYLWNLPPDPGMKEGWFYTENPEKLVIVKKNADGKILDELKCGDMDREVHISAYNRPDIISARILNPDKYRQLVEKAARISGYSGFQQSAVKLITETKDKEIP